MDGSKTTPIDADGRGRAPSLTEFLTARIDEDEAVALAATEGPWHANGKRDDGEWAADGCRIEGAGIIIYDESGHDEDQAAHIARHDPARVLAECEAKRLLLELHGPHGRDTEALPCRELAVLALPYADHPDYQPEWRP